MSKHIRDSTTPRLTNTELHMVDDIDRFLGFNCNYKSGTTTLDRDHQTTILQSYNFENYLSKVRMDVLAACPVQNEALLKNPKPGGWVPIENIMDPNVQEMGRFAVMEHNKKLVGSSSKFIRVVAGETQVVAGIKYRLVIEVNETIITANIASFIKFYEAVVLDKPWEKKWELLSWAPVLPLEPGPVIPPIHH